MQRYLGTFNDCSCSYVTCVSSLTHTQRSFLHYLSIHLFVHPSVDLSIHHTFLGQHVTHVFLETHLLIYHEVTMDSSDVNDLLSSFSFFMYKHIRILCSIHTCTCICVNVIEDQNVCIFRAMEQVWLAVYTLSMWCIFLKYIKLCYLWINLSLHVCIC